MSKEATGSSRSRIISLLDDNSFVEVGARITARSTDFNIKEHEEAGDGVITGYGTIDGNLVFIYSQDSAVLGGSVGEMHAKKISAIYQKAVRMGAPVIGLVDCSGLRLQESTDALEAFGSIYAAEAKASGIIPQITAVFGNCGGGMAVASAMSDFVFLEDNSRLFVNSPNALEGSDEKKLDIAAPKYQKEETGVADFVGTQEEIFDSIRKLVMILPSNNLEIAPEVEMTDDLNRLTENLSADRTEKVIEAVADNGRVFELKKDYEPNMITAFIRLNGETTGVIANCAERIDPEDPENVVTYEKALSARGAEKAAYFLEYCDAFAIPVLTLVNVNGYKKSELSERKIGRSAAKLNFAYADADVPMVTVITGEAFGTSAITMGSRSIGADIVLAWEGAKIGTMPAKAAVSIMYADELEKAEKKADFLKEKVEEFEKRTGTAEAAARRGYVDDIIKVSETRERILAAFEMLYSKNEDAAPRKRGTI